MGRKLNQYSKLIGRLNLETKLEAHTGCVNCLEWTQDGALLASGSDDRDVIIWDPFRNEKRASLKTGHEGNIFSVKFIPDYTNTKIATGGSDGKVKVIEVNTNKILLNCKSCHSDRVKRLAVHPKEPNIILSASEDGCILSYDLRERHSCCVQSKNLLIDLKTNSAFECLAAKCIDINPNRDEMIAVGANDVHVRLFDRRCTQSCTAYLTPGHLAKKSNSRSFGTTYLTFNYDGSELLANIHAEHVYLFNTYQPQEPYKDFISTAKPLFLEFPVEMKKTTSSWETLRRYRTNVEIPIKYQIVCDKFRSKLQAKEPLLYKELGAINEMLKDCNDCADLYALRALALTKRRWKGDFYQALRDCCDGLALKPGDRNLVEILSTASYLSGDKESVKAIEGLLLDSSSNDENDPMIESSTKSPDLDEDLVSHFTYLPAFFDVNSNNIQLMSGKYHGSVNQTPKQASATCDYTKRYNGHCNMNTDIKEANFFGNFIVAGSDDGAFYVWDKETTNIVKAVYGDMQVVNCIQPHPNICMLATSGIEPSVKIWSPSGMVSQDVESVEHRCQENHNFIVSDPLEAMIMRLYPSQRHI